MLLKGAQLRGSGAVDYEGVFVRLWGHFQPGRSEEPRLEVSEAVTSLECPGNLRHPCTCSSQAASCQLCGWRFEVHREKEDKVGNHLVKTERDLGRGGPRWTLGCPQLARRSWPWRVQSSRAIPHPTAQGMVFGLRVAPVELTTAESGPAAWLIA